MKLTTNDALNFGSVLCVSVSMATVIQVLQIITLIISIMLTIGSILLKIYKEIKQKTLTIEDLQEAKQDIDEIVDKVEKIKGEKDEWYIDI